MSERFELRPHERFELPHKFHHHAHPPHHYNPLGHNSGGGDGALWSLIGPPLAAHPVGWAIGAAVVIGIGAYLLLSDD